MISIEILWKSTAILAAAIGGCVLIRRGPAAWRHFLWTVAFATLLALPLIGILAPKWTPQVTLLDVVPLTTVYVPLASSAGPGPAPRFDWLGALWLAGCIAAAARFVLASVRTARIVRHATEAPHSVPNGFRRRARILESDQAPMPMTWGVFRPVVLLPKVSREWSADRLHTVLLHELTHVERRDLLAQVIAQIACSLYWFQPLAWLALRRLRDEREHACDDAVLLRGVAPHEYATHLLELVRRVAADRSPMSDALAMAEVSGFESRIRALLDRSRNRQPLRRAAALAIGAIGAAVLISFSAIHVQAQAGHGTLTGIVKDPSGARIPNCTVTAKHLDTGREEETTADLTGTYRFASIPSGRYTLAVSAQGFKTWRQELTLVAGAVDREDASLAVGSISHTLRILGVSGPGVVLKAATATPEKAVRVRIGGNVSHARLLPQPKPVYPEELKNAGIEGTVVLSAIIGKDGTIRTVRIVRASDDRLAQAALEAVKQWRYEPARLNGEPIEVVSEIDMQFSLGQ